MRERAREPRAGNGCEGVCRKRSGGRLSTLSRAIWSGIVSTILMTGRGQAGRGVVAARGDWVGNNGDRRVWAKWDRGARRGINPAGGGVLRSMYAGAEISYSRGGVRRSWGGWNGRREEAVSQGRRPISEMEMERGGDSGRGSSRKGSGVRTSRE